MLLHIFGDTHGPDEISKINPKRFLDRNLTKEDVIVVCGDFGFPFFPTDRIPADDLKTLDMPQHCIKSARAYQMYTDWMKSFPCNILFIDGNHDNHTFWAEQPTERWNGGLIQRLPEAPNVIHLMRGEYYTIDGITVWCMGGAESIDKAYRTEGVTWWREEVPSQKEMWHGLDALDEHEAEAIRQKGLAEAEAMKQKAEAYKQYNDAAVAEMYADCERALQCFQKALQLDDSSYKAMFQIACLDVADRKYQHAKAGFKKVIVSIQGNDANPDWSGMSLEEILYVYRSYVWLAKLVLVSDGEFAIGAPIAMALNAAVAFRQATILDACCDPENHQRVGRYHGSGIVLRAMFVLLRDMVGDAETNRELGEEIENNIKCYGIK